MSGPIGNSVRMSGNYTFATVQGGPAAGQASGTPEQRKMANFIAVGEDGKAVLTGEELHQIAAFDKSDGDDQLTEKDLLAAGIRGDIIPKILDTHEKSPFSPIQIDFARTTLKDVNPISSGTEKNVEQNKFTPMASRLEDNLRVRLLDVLNKVDKGTTPASLDQRLQGMASGERNAYVKSMATELAGTLTRTDMYDNNKKSFELFTPTNSLTSGLRQMKSVTGNQGFNPFDPKLTNAKVANDSRNSQLVLDLFKDQLATALANQNGGPKAQQRGVEAFFVVMNHPGLNDGDKEKALAFLVSKLPIEGSPKGDLLNRFKESTFAQGFGSAGDLYQKLQSKEGREALIATHNATQQAEVQQREATLYQTFGGR